MDHRGYQGAQQGWAPPTGAPIPGGYHTGSAGYNPAQEHQYGQFPGSAPPRMFFFTLRSGVWLIDVRSETAAATAVLRAADAGWSPGTCAAAFLPVFAVYGCEKGFVCEFLGCGEDLMLMMRRSGSIIGGRVQS